MIRRTALLLAYFLATFAASAEETPAEPKSKDAPDYPVSCYPDDVATLIDHTVDIGFDIDREGLTENVAALHLSDPCFEEVAIAAVRSWVYEPRRVDGRSAPQAGMQATFKFSYNGQTSVDEFDAQPIERVGPKYPGGCARTASDRETIKVQFDVSKQGKTQNVEIIERSNPCFKYAVHRAVEQWEYRPRFVNGEPTIREGVVATLVFSLRHGRLQKQYRVRRKVASELSRARNLMQKDKIDEALSRLDAYNEKAGDDMTPAELGHFHRLRGAARLAKNDLQGALDDFRIAYRLGGAPQGSGIGRKIYELETALGVLQLQPEEKDEEETPPAE